MITMKVTIARQGVRVVAAGLLLFALLSPSVCGQEKPFSGPQPGESLSPFKVLQVVTPNKVKKVEIAKPEGDETTLLMFMNKLSEPAIGLMITIEWYAAKQKDVTSHYVMLTDDVPKATSMAKRWAQRPFFSKSPMSISVDGPEGPGRYGLNRLVDMTVLVAKNNRVVHNFAIDGSNNTDAPKILAAIAKTIRRPAPSLEKIRAELRAERQKRREVRLRETPLYKLAPNDQLGKLMVAMIYRERVTEQVVKEQVAAMKKWAEDDAEKKAALATYAGKVLKGDFELNRYAREALEKLSGK